jgi:hypothetical protein
MNIIVLNGNQDPISHTFDSYLNDLSEKLQEKGHILAMYCLREMDIRQCIGCFNCFTKTPGICIHADDMIAVYKTIVRSDLMVFASPLSMGFVSSTIKRATDRIIPLVLPYLQISQGECRHPLRYARSPLLGLLVGPEEDTDDEDAAIVADMHKRLASNFHSELKFTRLTKDPVAEVAYEINNL